MKKRIFLILLGLSLFLIGCDTTPTTLNTKLLTKEKGNNTEYKSLTVIYTASSIKKALKSLPFHVTLPKTFPFDTKGYQNVEIDDLNHNGKDNGNDIMFSVSAFSKAKKNPDILTITASNYAKIAHQENTKKVKLKKGIIGHYKGTGLNFTNKGILYMLTLSFNSNPVTEQQHQKDLIQLANQMIK